MTFKAGDKIECVDNDGYESLLEVGRVYEVVNSDRDFTTIKYNSSSKTYSFFHSRFKLVEEKPMEFKAGDRVVCVNNSGVSSFVKIGDCGTVDTVSKSLGLLVRMDDGSLRFFESGRFEILLREKFKVGSRVRCVDNSCNEDKSYLGCLTVYPDKQHLNGGDFKLISEYDKDDVIISIDNTYSTIRISEHRVRILIKHLEEWLKTRRFDF